MEIRMLVGLAGNEYALGPGDTRDFPNGEAIRLIEAGYAVPVSEKKTERAVLEPAQERRGNKRGNHVVRANGDDTADQ